MIWRPSCWSLERSTYSDLFIYFFYKNTCSWELCEVRLWKYFSKYIAPCQQKLLLSTITTQTLNLRLTECAVLLYLAEKYLTRNEFCLFVYLEKVIHIFTFSQLDYCFSLYCGLKCKANSQLQPISKCSSLTSDRQTKRGSYRSCAGVTSSLRKIDFENLPSCLGTLQLQVKVGELFQITGKCKWHLAYRQTGGKFLLLINSNKIQW